MGSSANSNQNMNMIIPGRALQTKITKKDAIRVSLQTFTGLALSFGAVNHVGSPQSNQTLTRPSILCSALGKADRENLKVQD